MVSWFPFHNRTCTCKMHAAFPGALAVFSLYEISSFLNRFRRSWVCLPAFPLKTPVLDESATRGVQLVDCFWYWGSRNLSFLSDDDQKRSVFSSLNFQSMRQRVIGLEIPISVRVGVVVSLIKLTKEHNHVTEKRKFCHLIRI